MKKKRVVHLISKLEPGGIEKWLLSLLELPSEKYEHIILCISGDKGQWSQYAPDYAVYDYPSLRGGRIGFLFGLRGFVRANNIEICHSHLYRFSAVISLVLLGLGISFVSHSHNDKRAQLNKLDFFSRLRGRAFRWLAICVFRLFSDGRLAASKDAGDDLFGGGYNVVHCGINLPVFRSGYQDERNHVRRFVTVGSLTEQKNHFFLIDVAQELNSINFDDFEFWIIGDGPLRPLLEERVKESRLEQNVKFLGVRNDVHRIMLNEADFFVFPSIFEGLGLAFIEAQAAGLRCFISDCIPLEADVAADSVIRLPLDVSVWVEAVMGAVPLSEQQRLLASSELAASDFNIVKSIVRLEEFYNASCS